MKYKLEYSQIVRRKLKSLKLYLSEQYGEDFAKSAAKKITDRARVLQDNPDIGVDMAAKYEIDTDFRELYVNHNHLFYYKDNNTILDSILESKVILPERVLMANAAAKSTDKVVGDLIDLTDIFTGEAASHECENYLRENHDEEHHWKAEKLEASDRSDEKGERAAKAEKRVSEKGQDTENVTPCSVTKAPSNDIGISSFHKTRRIRKMKVFY